MFQTFTVQRLATGSLFKLLAIGSVLSFVPFALLMGVLALFGASTVSWNGRPLTGVSGLLAAPFMGFFIALVFTLVFGGLCAFGLWLFAKFRPLRLSAQGLETQTLP